MRYSKLEGDARKVSPTAPFADSKAHEWATKSLADWSRAKGWTSEGRELATSTMAGISFEWMPATDMHTPLCAHVSGAMDVEPTDVSFLFTLMYLNSSGGSVENFESDRDNGAQAFKVRYTM